MWAHVVVVALLVAVCAAEGGDNDYMLNDAESFVRAPDEHYGDVRYKVASHFGGPWDVNDPANDLDDPENVALGGQKNGACGFKHQPRYEWPFWRTAAFNMDDADMVGMASEGCGSCWRLTCVDEKQCIYGEKTVVMLVADTCYPCRNTFDINWNTAVAMHDVSHNQNARMKIERVLCDPRASVLIDIDEYEGPGKWLRVIPKRVAALGIVKDLYINCGGTTLKLNNLWGGTFEHGQAPWGSMCSFTIVQEDGAQLTTGEINMWEYKGSEYDTQMQFDTPYDGVGSAAEDPTEEEEEEKDPNGWCDECYNARSPEVPNLSCATQKRKGFCDEEWMWTPTIDLPFGYCAFTCGTCTCP